MTIHDIAQVKTVIKDMGAIVTSIAAAIEEQATRRDVAGNISLASAEVQKANRQFRAGPDLLFAKMRATR